MFLINSAKKETTGLQQHVEAFLAEMLIMRENVADLALTHRIHRDTIRQTVAFVGTRFVKSETSHECRVALGHYFDVGTAENLLSLSDRSTGFLTVLRKEIQQLYENVFGGD